MNHFELADLEPRNVTERRNLDSCRVAGASDWSFDDV